MASIWAWLGKVLTLPGYGEHSEKLGHDNINVSIFKQNSETKTNQIFSLTESCLHI